MKMQIDNEAKTLEFTEELTVEEVLDIADLLEKFKDYKIVFSKTIYIYSSNPWTNPCIVFPQYPTEPIYPTAPVMPYYTTGTTHDKNIDEARG